MMAVVTTEDSSGRASAGRRAAAPSLADAERYRMTFELAPIGLAHLHLDGRYLRVNPRMLGMLGYSAAELLDRSFRDITHADDITHEEAEMARLLAGEADECTWEKRFLRRDGAAFWARVTRRLAHGPDGRPDFFVAAVEDVNARVRAEAALAESRRQLAGIIDMAMDAILSVDGEHRIVRFNRAAAAVLRCPVAEAIGQPLERFIPERLHARHRDHMARFAGSGETSRVVGHLQPIFARRADGVEIPIEASISRIVTDAGPLYTVIFRDVSARLAADVALRESERRFAAAFRQSPVALVLSTCDDGRILEVSDRFLELFGRARDEVLGRSSTELRMYEDAKVRAHLVALLERDGVLREIEVPMRGPDGQRRWALISAEIVVLGGARCYLSAMVDITERKRLASQLEHAQRMESVGLLAGGIAHDFNNLLTAIVGYADLIVGAPGGSDVRGEAREIEGAAARAAQLTRQLLTFARRQPIDATAVDLGGLIRELGGLLRRLISEDIDLAIQVDEATAPVWGDAGQLQQVLVNLAVNARDAMPEGGELQIRACDVDLDAAAIHDLPDLSPGAHVVLTVRDTGCGMPPEVRAHIFEPFYTTKPPGTGTGLGLSTCYGIVKQHRGAIGIESEVGIGTSVHIYLPRAEDVTAPAIPSVDEVAATLPGGAETVLLVEDEPVVRAFAARVLGGCGYEVHEASDGVEALTIADAIGPESIDLLLTDVVMPRLGGPATAARLRLRAPLLRVLYMSGYTGHAAAQSLVDGGAAMLHKPFTPATLALAVRTALDHMVLTEGA